MKYENFTEPGGLLLCLQIALLTTSWTILSLDHKSTQIFKTRFELSSMFYVFC